MWTFLLICERSQSLMKTLLIPNETSSCVFTVLQLIWMSPTLMISTTGTIFSNAANLEQFFGLQGIQGRVHAPFELCTKSAVILKWYAVEENLLRAKTYIHTYIRTTYVSKDSVCEICAHQIPALLNHQGWSNLNPPEHLCSNWTRGSLIITYIHLIALTSSSIFPTE